MRTNYITFENREETGIITLNSPQTLNSVNAEMLQELVAQIEECNQNRKIKVIVLKGIEKSFAAGLDVKGLAADIHNAKTTIQKMQNDFQKILSSPKPLIAAVSGFALGIGCELALCCDIILATDSSRFGMPELSIGLLPCFGGCGLLSSRIGKAKAMDMILSGKALSADEAERAGLISRVVTGEALTEEYMKLAKRIAALPQAVVASAKKIVSQYTYPKDVSFENLLCLNAIDSEDFRKILQSFASNKSVDGENS